MCSVGIDMVVIPGRDRRRRHLGPHRGRGRHRHGELEDHRRARDPRCRRKEPGDVLDFGGLLGYAPIMKVSTLCAGRIRKPRRAHPRPHAGPEKLSGTPPFARRPAEKEVSFPCAFGVCAGKPPWAAVRLAAGACCLLHSNFRGDLFCSAGQDCCKTVFPGRLCAHCKQAYFN